ncbi:MAG TPA: maleylpyruvate isomerase N-terminal domain-containing protein [Kineosporiaceae bacterium]|nr:maleylpyruvate isomerase N-terminal domain-containing protein [Kineosporiaceae bacterium]
MSGTSPSLRPEPLSRGLASGDPEDLAELFAGAWDAMIDLAGRIYPDQPSRLDGWTVRDVLIHLGSWEEHRIFARLLDDARHGRVHELDDADARNDLVVAAHHDASAEEILAALADARDRGLDFLCSPEAHTLGREWTETALGQLPVAGVLAASTFELAVHALDIAEPEQIPVALLDAGVAALVDLVGALAARRGLRTMVAVVTPSGSWGTSTEPNSWMTVPLAPVQARELRWPAVEGCAQDILDAAAGRQLAAQLLLTRRFRLHDLPALLRLTPALEEVTGLPGGPALRAAARTLGQTAQLIGRLGNAVRNRF